ncbi:hypothetical protein MIDIC_110011 [Alphaproteobacteria bacterium]
MLLPMMLVKFFQRTVTSRRKLQKKLKKSKKSTKIFDLSRIRPVYGFDCSGWVFFLACGHPEVIFAKFFLSAVLC